MVANLNPDCWQNHFQQKCYKWHWPASAPYHDAFYRMFSNYPGFNSFYRLFNVAKFIDRKLHAEIF